MAQSSLCDAWYDLITSKDRGKVYDQFNRERVDLIKHLEHCDICKNIFNQIEPLSTYMDIDQLGSLEPAEFAILIRELYTNAQKMFFDDSVNTDHD